MQNCGGLGVVYNIDGSSIIGTQKSEFPLNRMIDKVILKCQKYNNNYLKAIIGMHNFKTGIYNIVISLHNTSKLLPKGKYKHLISVCI